MISMVHAVGLHHLYSCSLPAIRASKQDPKTSTKQHTTLLNERASVPFEDEHNTMRSRTCTVQACHFFRGLCSAASPAYVEQHAQCSCPPEVASTCISRFVHAPLADVVQASLSLHIATQPHLQCSETCPTSLHTVRGRRAPPTQTQKQIQLTPVPDKYVTRGSSQPRA